MKTEKKAERKEKKHSGYFEKYPGIKAALTPPTDLRGSFSFFYDLFSKSIPRIKKTIPRIKNEIPRVKNAIPTAKKAIPAVKNEIPRIKNKINGARDNKANETRDNKETGAQNNKENYSAKKNSKHSQYEEILHKRDGVFDFGLTHYIEDLYIKTVNKFLRNVLKYQYAIEPYVCYGNCEKIGIYSRVVLRSKLRKANKLRRGVRTLFTAQVPGRKVTVAVDGKRIKKTLVSDRGGYVEDEIEISLAPGHHRVDLFPEDGYHVSTDLVVHKNEKKIAVISDIDDTVMVSMVPYVFHASFNLLFRNPNLRKPVKGMSNLYNWIAGICKDPFFTYVTSTPWNVEPTVKNFIKANDFPKGPIIARDWGPNENSLFVWSTTHKYLVIERLFKEFPDIKWILIGDNGQKDPLMYKLMADIYPDNVFAIMIRQFDETKKVNNEMYPVPYKTDSGKIVPVFYGWDGYVLKEQAEKYLYEEIRKTESETE